MCGSPIGNPAVSVLIILILVYRNPDYAGAAGHHRSAGVTQGTLSGLAEFGPGFREHAGDRLYERGQRSGAGNRLRRLFLISRYHDYVRHGEKSDMAVMKALMPIGKAITASAATPVAVILAEAAHEKRTKTRCA